MPPPLVFVPGSALGSCLHGALSSAQAIIHRSATTRHRQRPCRRVHTVARLASRAALLLSLAAFQLAIPLGDDHPFATEGKKGVRRVRKGSGSVPDIWLAPPYRQDIPRPRRAAEGGLIYHALNRANARLAIFDNDDDYAAFEQVLQQAVARFDVRLLSYCLMPNHFRLPLWPREDGDLSTFMRWLTMTHTRRSHAHHGTAGTGQLYQGRYKSFPVQPDEHLLTVCRSSNGTRCGRT